MDVTSALICVGVVAISAIVIYITSVFGMKEKTYEEAIEEQRQRALQSDPTLLFKIPTGKPETSNNRKSTKDKAKKQPKKVKEKEPHFKDKGGDEHKSSSASSNKKIQNAAVHNNKGHSVEINKPEPTSSAIAQSSASSVSSSIPAPPPPSRDPKPEQEANEGKTKTVSPQNASSSSSSTKAQSTSVINNQVNKKSEHVEFVDEPRVVIVEEDEDGEGVKQRIRMNSAGSESKQAGKPILISRPNSIIEGVAQDSVSGGSKQGGSKQAGKENTFDIIHPKDELELIRARREKSSRNSSVVDANSRYAEMVDGGICIEGGQLAPNQNTSDSGRQPNGPTKKTPEVTAILEAASRQLSHASGDIKVAVTLDPSSATSGTGRSSASGAPNQNQSEIRNELVIESSSSNIVSPARKSKKHRGGQHANAFTNSNDIGEAMQDASPKSVIDMVKNVALSNDEIQQVIDVLLNKQGEVSTEWHKKNDPVGFLKKQLQEKETDYARVMQNLNMAKARISELRQELAQEKSRGTATYNFMNQKQMEVQQLSIQLTRTQEQHRNDVKALQMKIGQLQKMTEERADYLRRIEEENHRLTASLGQKSESERTSLEKIQHLTHELEALRREKQLVDQNQGDIANKLQQKEQELNQVKNEKGNLESDYETKKGELEDKLKEQEEKIKRLEEENNRLNASLKEKSEEAERTNSEKLDQLEKELEILRKEKSQLEESSASLSERLKGKEEEVEKLVADKDANASSSQERIVELEKRLEEETKSREESVKRLEEENERLNEALKQKSEEASKEVNERAEQLSKEVEERRRANEELEESHAKLKEELNAKCEELNRVKEEKGNVECNLEQRIKELEDERSKERGERDEQIKRLQEESEKNSQELKDQKSRVEESENKLGQLNGELERLRHEKQALEESQNGIREQLEQRGKELDETKSEKCKIQSDSEQRIKELEEKLQQVQSLCKEQEEKLQQLKATATTTDGLPEKQLNDINSHSNESPTAEAGTTVNDNH